MRKNLHRLVALVVVSCMLADPALAGLLGTGYRVRDTSYPVPSTRGVLFDEEALSNLLLNFFKTGDSAAAAEEYGLAAAARWPQVPSRPSQIDDLLRRATHS